MQENQSQWVPKIKVNNCFKEQGGINYDKCFMGQIRSGMKSTTFMQTIRTSLTSLLLWSWVVI